MPETVAVPHEHLLDSLRADQIERWHRGERRLVEHYLDSAPDLRGDDDAVLDLIYSEIVVRDELGESPALAEYLRRFPHFDAALRRQFTVHRLLESPSLQSPAVLPRHTKSAETPGSSPVTPPTDPGADGILSALSDFPSVPGYEILGELGRGGMGVVYRARDVKLNRIVALKLICAIGADVSSRFRTEAETAARLQHPNIVQIYECGASAAGPYVALEYVDGESLDRKIDGTPLPAREAAELLLPLARAMHYAHGQGVVHRDLKPANVLLAACGLAERASAKPQAAVMVPKIADFGLAKSLDADSGQTKSGAVLGTPSYMAPEQASGHSREVGPAADVYALGAILYEMLTGRPPFKAATAMETMQQVVGEEPVPPRRLQSATPRDLETICSKCLRKEPHKRYATAAELAVDLERFLAGEPIRARPVGWAERLAMWVRRRPAAAALTGVIALAVVALLGLGIWYNGRLSDANNRLSDEQKQTVVERDQARKQEAIATDLQQKYEKERNNAVEQEAEARRQRDQVVRLLKINVAAVRDHAKVVVEGKQADYRTKNPGEVLYQLACAYARSSEAFRTDANLVPAHARWLSEEYADSAMILLLAARELGYFDSDPICYKLDKQEELKLLSERREFKQLLNLPKGRGTFPKP